MLKRLLIILLGLAVGGVIGCQNSNNERHIDKHTAEYHSTTEGSQKAYEEASKEVEGHGITIESFIEQYDIEITAKEVQHNMERNLNVRFFLEGQAKLDNYYNYGFDSSMEKNYFVVTVEPTNGSLKDRWYLYCNRDVYSRLYDSLIEKTEVYIAAGAIIPEGRYKEGQGNMALAEVIAW